MPYADRQTRLQYLKDYRALNPDMRERTVYQRVRRDLGRAFLRELKDVPCMDCGGEFHHSAMEFDHRPGENKTWDLSRLISRNASVKTLAQEAAKCDVVCANCHRIRTWIRSHDEHDNPLPGEGHNTSAADTQRQARARRRRAKDNRALSVVEAIRSGTLDQQASELKAYIDGA